VRRSILIIGFTAIMFVGSELIYKILSLFLSTNSVLSSFIMVMVVASFGAFIYAFLGYRSKLIYLLFGERAYRIKTKLRLPF
jgi:hypothetical protein